MLSMHNRLPHPFSKPEASLPVLIVARYSQHASASMSRGSANREGSS
jgi:hypothetical protein